jgi:hypothetical protein
MRASERVSVHRHQSLPSDGQKFIGHIPRSKCPPADIVVADMNAVVVVPAENTAELLKKAQRLHESEHNRLPYIEKYKSIREAVAEFGRL